MSLYSPMIRSAPRSLLRSSNPLIRPLRPRRQFSLAPPSQRSRSWRNVTIRLGLAICGIYYYNTSNLFAEEPISTAPTPSSPTDEASVETLESLAAARRKSRDAPSDPSTSSNNNLPDSPSHPSPLEKPSSLDETAEEASQEAAFNEETGEINWDCPCLGGMAHGPCGEEFRASFSCFVFSKEDPKGMDCIEHFKVMQDCFHRHPEVYAGEMDDENASGGDPEHPSREINDNSTSPHPSVDDKPTPPKQADQETETKNPPSPRSAPPPHPKVDEPSKNAQPPPDLPQSSSGALESAASHEQQIGKSTPNLVPYAETDADKKSTSATSSSSPETS